MEEEIHLLPNHGPSFLLIQMTTSLFILLLGGTKYGQRADGRVQQILDVSIGAKK